MATWRRCDKSSFYRKEGHPNYGPDKRAAALDRTYVDPVDLIVVRTIPWYKDLVTVLKWRIIQLEIGISDDLERGEAELLAAWTERVLSEMDGGIHKTKKGVLLGDLDVDVEARDTLLSAVERFVDTSPAEATSLVQQRVPENDEAVKGLLFHFGVGPC